MPINDEVAVWSLLVLANASFHQRCALQGREAKAEILANVLQNFLADHALTHRGIEDPSARIIRNLEPTPVTPRNSVTKAPPMIGPHWQTPVAKTIVPSRRDEDV